MGTPNATKLKSQTVLASDLNMDKFPIPQDRDNIRWFVVSAISKDRTIIFLCLRASNNAKECGYKVLHNTGPIELRYDMN